MNKKIIIAEDEKAMSKVLTLKLEKAGFDVFIAFNGKQALDILKKNKIDLILLDLMMPVMDGFTFLEKIKNKKEKITVFILSNLGQQDDIDKAIELGATEFFIKSNISIPELIKKVEVSVK